jgi:hypothetical protein
MWFDVLGLSCIALSVRRTSYALAAIAGVCFFLMVSFRIPSALHVVAWLPLIWVLLRAHPAWRAAGVVMAVVAGTAVCLLLLYVHARGSGYFDELIAVLGRNVRYGALDRVPLGASLYEAIRTIARIAMHSPVAGLLVTMTAVVLARNWVQVTSREKWWLLVAVLWMAAALAAAFPGGRHYAHYYHLCWPAASVLSIGWLERVRTLPAGRRLARQIAWGLAAGCLLMAAASQLFLAARAYRDYRNGTHPRVAIRQAADYIDRTTTPDTPVLMNLWGSWAELYWRAARPAASLSVPHVIPKDRYDDWLRANLASPPKWIVTDGTPLEPIDGGREYTASKNRLEQWQRMIEQNYVEVKRIGDLKFLVRRGDRE